VVLTSVVQFPNDLGNFRQKIVWSSPHVIWAMVSSTHKKSEKMDTVKSDMGEEGRDKSFTSSKESTCS